MLKRKPKPNAHHEEFNRHYYTRINADLEWLAYLGQPMLYDGELFVVRGPQNMMTYAEYFRWVNGIRVC